VTQDFIEGSQREELERLVGQVDVVKLVETFDADYDVPLAHGTAIGVLHMKGAFEARSDEGPDGRAVAVGACWCDIVRSDVELDLRHGLARVDASALDAARLSREAGSQGTESGFAAYAAARWNDGAASATRSIGMCARTGITPNGTHSCRRTIRKNWMRAS